MSPKKKKKPTPRSNADKLRTLMRRHELEQNDVAFLCHVSIHTVRQWRIVIEK